MAAAVPQGNTLPAPVTAADRRTRNLAVDRWSPDETATVKTAPDRYTAVERYREKFPGSTRSDDAIFRHFFNLRPDLRKVIPAWSDEEMAPILSADTVEDALAEYRRQFPGSTRSDPAVRREWYELRPEKRGLAHRGRKLGGRNTVPLKGTFREKFRIPMSSKQDPKGYNAAVYFCRKFDKPYDEALPLWTKCLAERRRRREMRLQKLADRDQLKKERKKRSRIEKPVPAIKKERQKPVVPEKPPAEIPKFTCGYLLDQQVVHQGSKSSPYFGWTGRIVKIVRTGSTEHLMVSFGKGGAVLILPKFVKPAGGAP